VFLTYVRSGSHFTTGRRPESDRNRRIRSRMSGGVGPVADVSQSRGPDSTFLAPVSYMLRTVDY
jgi:hypothetical protein